MAAMSGDHGTQAFEHAKRVFGGVSAIARHLKVDRRCVYLWEGKIPRARRWELFVLAQGQLSLAELEIQEDFNARKLPKPRRSKT